MDGMELFAMIREAMSLAPQLCTVSDVVKLVLQRHFQHVSTTLENRKMKSSATKECIQGSLDVQAYLYGVYCRIPRLRFLSLCVNLAASMADVARGE